MVEVVQGTVEVGQVWLRGVATLRIVTAYVDYATNYSAAHFSTKKDALPLEKLTS